MGARPRNFIELSMNILLSRQAIKIVSNKDLTNLETSYINFDSTTLYN